MLAVNVLDVLLEGVALSIDVCEVLSEVVGLAVIDLLSLL